MDVLKGQLAAVLKSQTRFGLIQFITSIVSWTVVIGLTTDVYAKDKLAFTCSCEDKESTASNRRCYESYAKQYNEPLSQLYFALISGCVLVGSWVIHAICTAPRIHHFQQGRRQVVGRSCCSAYLCYLLEVLLRICFTGAMITAYFLQQRKSFPDVFPCHLISEDMKSDCKCYDVYNTEKTDLNYAMLVINAVLCFLSLVEMVYMIIILRCDSRFRLARRDPFSYHIISHQHSGRNFCSIPTDGRFISFLLNESQDGIEDMIDAGNTRIREFSIELMNRTLRGTETFSSAFTLDGFDDLLMDEIYTQTVVTYGRTTSNVQGKYRHEVLQRYPAATTPPEMTLEQFSESFVCRPVLVIGRAGIGKTVFSLKLLREWAKGTLLRKFVFVFLFNFRHLNLIKSNQMINLKGLLALSPYSPEIEKNAFTFIKRHPRQVLFIFDGLDEFRDHMLCLTQEKRYPNMAKCRMPLPSLYAKLTMGKILTGAAVITTTRPATVACVAEIYGHVSIFEIMGFTTDSIKCYLNQYFDHHKRLERIIFEYIFSNAGILSLCYIPVCCMIICSYLKFVCSEYSLDDHSVSSFDSLPHTLTQLYNGVLKMFIIKHSPEYREVPLQEIAELSQRAQETVEKLSLLAFTTLKMSKLIFRRKDFVELGLEKDIAVLINSGLIHCMPGCRTGPVTFENQYCFVHLTLQEFLAAKRISFSEDEFIEFVQSPSFFPKWELVVQFVAGLLPENDHNGSAWTADLFRRLNGGVHNVLSVNGVPETQDSSQGSLSVAAGSYSTSAAVSISPHSSLASEHFDYIATSENCENSTDVSAVQCSGRNPSSNVCYDELRCHGDLLLLEMKCVYEQQDRQRASEVAVRIGKDLDLSGIQISDVDIYAAVFFIFNHAVTGILKDMNLFNNHITGLGCTKLAELLCYGHGPSRSLNLDRNAVGDEGVRSLADAMKHFKCTLERLNLSTNGLSRMCVDYLSNAIMHPNCNLRTLDIGYNKIGKSSLAPLGDALTQPNCKITCLDLADSGIGDEDCEILAQSLKHSNCQLVILNIQSNRSVSCDGMVSLVSTLSKRDCKLESLNLSSMECSEEEMMKVCNELENSLTCVDSKLKSLSLYCSQINDDSLCTLMKVVANPRCKLACLDLGNNLIGDEGCHNIVKALCSPGCGLNDLKLQQNRIDDKGAEVFTCVLESQSFKLESLDLSCNNISHDAQIALINAWGELRGGLTLI